MKILLTNDDSIESPGILLLADAFRKIGHRVVVLAPKTDQSGVSHAITFINGPRKLTKIGEDTWTYDGTPADCIVVGLLGGLDSVSLRDSPPDLIVSGINRGANLGTDILYSGTAAAARQGALCDIPSIALSLVENTDSAGTWNWDMAVGFAAERLDEMVSYWKPDSFINVNIPNLKEKPLKLVLAFPSFRYYNDRIEVYHAPDGQRYCFSACGETTAKPERGSDYDMVMGKNASISEIYIHPLLLRRVGGSPEGGDNG